MNAVRPGGRDRLVGTSNPAKAGSLGFTDGLSSRDPITAHDLLSGVGLLATWAREVGAPIRVGVTGGTARSAILDVTLRLVILGSTKLASSDARGVDGSQTPADWALRYVYPIPPDPHKAPAAEEVDGLFLQGLGVIVVRVGDEDVDIAYSLLFVVTSDPSRTLDHIQVSVERLFVHFPDESGKIDRLPRACRGMLVYVGGDTCDHYLGVSEVSGKGDVGEGDAVSEALFDCVGMGEDGGIGIGGLEAKDDLVSSALSRPTDRQGIEGVNGFIDAVDSTPHFPICHAARDALGTMSELYYPGLRCVNRGRPVTGCRDREGNGPRKRTFASGCRSKPFGRGGVYPTTGGLALQQRGGSRPGLPGNRGPGRGGLRDGQPRRGGLEAAGEGSLTGWV